MELTVENLLDEAKRQTGFSDYGTDRSFLTGLDVLVAAIETMRPSDYLRADARGRILNYLTARLRIIEDDRLYPEIRAQRIEKPTIILGLPRSGTTVTYDMLALDNSFRYPREWEWAIPWPATEAASIDTDPRIAMLQPYVERFAAAAPELAGIVHRLDITAPGECNNGMMYHFSSTNYYAEIGVADHAHWLAKNNPEGIYRDHKRLLQQMQWKGPRGQWLLKSPQHLFDLPALLNTYPDAQLIWAHRDPVFTFSSLSSMIVMLLRAVKLDPDPKQVGAIVVKLWSKALLNAVSARAADPAIDRAVFDLSHAALARDPKGQLRRIYQRFGKPLSPEFERRLDAFLSGNDRAQRLGKHRHSAATFGIDPEEVHEVLKPYYARFGHLLPPAAAKPP